MVDNARAARMAKRIQTIVASAIEREIKDRRLEFITVTAVTMTGDLHDATIFYTVRGENLGDEPDLDAAAEALHRARGQLRKIVGEQLGVRFTPTLTYRVDTVPEASAHMEALLERARKRDAELAELKKNARPAGDANPYKDAADGDEA